jgi:hypothetical protein
MDAKKTLVNSRHWNHLFRESFPLPMESNKWFLFSSRREISFSEAASCLPLSSRLPPSSLSSICLTCAFRCHRRCSRRRRRRQLDRLVVEGNGEQASKRLIVKALGKRERKRASEGDRKTRKGGSGKSRSGWPSLCRCLLRRCAQVQSPVPDGSTISVEKVALFCNPASRAGSQALQLRLYIN